jgi:hypothetical protein
VLFCGLLAARGFSREAAVVDVTGELAGQVEVVVDDVLEMNTGSARVLQQRQCIVSSRPIRVSICV